MKFYEIKSNRIINLFVIRTAQVFNNEILLSYTCGDTRSDRIIFTNNQEAADAFDKLRAELGVEVRNED
jgi:hypothetical protein